MVTLSSSPSLKSMLGAQPRRTTYYRRCTTLKAPRKRTFVDLYMEKHNPGVRSTGAGSTLCKASVADSSELLQACCGSGNNNNNCGHPPRDGNDSSSSGGERPVPRALVVAAAALLAALVLLPTQHAIASGASGLRRVGGSAAHPASTHLCLNHAMPSAAAVPLGAIVYGQVPLSDTERRVLARSSRQLFFSECVRVGASAAAGLA